MASQPSPSPSRPPPKERPKPPAPTTIAALGDDLLWEIFVRLPDLPSLACAAFACRAFLRSVCSSRDFRRRFRALHASPLLALFETSDMRVVPAFTAARRPSDPDLAADTDLFHTFLRDDDADNMWRLVPYISPDGYVALANQGTEQYAHYNPQTKALALRAKEPRDTILEFHTLSDQEGQRPSRVVCVRHDASWASVRVAVFSSNTMEWQISPEAATLLPEGNKRTFRTVLDGFVCWNYEGESYIFVLNTATFELSRMDLPPQLNEGFKIGQTKDGMLCIVEVVDLTLVAWIWRADEDGVERFVLGKTFLLNNRAIEDITKCSAQGQVQIMAVRHGFVYLSMKELNGHLKSSEWFLSFSLETEELNEMFKSNSEILVGVSPYIMEWPPSLVHNKENSECEVAGDSGENGGPAGKEEARSILTLALQSFREALINDDEWKVAEIEALLCLDAEDEKDSLVRKITTSDAALSWC